MVYFNYLEVKHMANEIKLTDVLFKYQSGTIVDGVTDGSGTVCFGSKSEVGITSEIGARSKPRGRDFSKMSLAAGILKPFSIGEIKVGYNSDKIYAMEVEHKGIQGVVILNSNTGTVSRYNINGRLTDIYAFILYALVCADEASEYIKSLCTDIVTSINADLAYKFADAVYYICKDSFNTYSVKDMTEAEMNQLISTTSFNKIDLVSDKIFTVNGRTPDFTMLNTVVSSKKRESASSTDIETFKNEVFAGSYLTEFSMNCGYDMDDPMAQHPSIDLWDTYKPPARVISLIKRCKKQLDEINLRVVNGETNPIGYNPLNFLFFGAAGGGKSMATQALAGALGMPLYSIGCSKNTEEDTFRGMNVIVNGTPMFKETEFLHGAKHGGVIVLEEANLANAAVIQGILSLFAAFPYRIAENGVTPVTRHHQVILIICMNTGYNGTRDLNEATQSRFAKALEFEEITEIDFMDIFVMNGYKKKNINKVWKVYNTLRESLKASEDTCDLVDLVSFRHARECLDSLKYGEEFAEAIESTFVNSVKIRNPEVAESLKSDILPMLK